MNRELVVVTGMSGAGRSTVAHALEDLGYLVMDNIPPQLLTEALDLLPPQVTRLAVVADVRGGKLFSSLVQALPEIKTKVNRTTLLFLEASNHVLVRRFESSRRPHPLQSGIGLLDAIQAERELLYQLREDADLILDTSEKNVHDLRRTIDASFDSEHPELHITLTSFGFKYGIPIDADLVADVRFLPNPFWDPELKELTGLDEPVRDFVLNLPDAKNFVAQYAELLQSMKAGYLREGKRYVTLAVGCTGGQHRSVAIAEHLAAVLRTKQLDCVVTHRDRGRE